MEKPHRKSSDVIYSVLWVNVQDVTKWIMKTYWIPIITIIGKKSNPPVLAHKNIKHHNVRRNCMVLKNLAFQGNYINYYCIKLLFFDQLKLREKWHCSHIWMHNICFPTQRDQT